MDQERAIGAGQPHEMSRERLAHLAKSHHARRCEAIANELSVAKAEGIGYVAIGSMIPLRQNPDGTWTYI